MKTDELLAKHPIISDQVGRAELRTLLRELERLLQKGCSGAVVEFGCYVGTTSLFIRRLLNCYDNQMEFHVYDSFEGLPQKDWQDESRAGEQFTQGELAASKKQFLRSFAKAHLRPPIVHKGWFGTMTAADVPEAICFAFLDGDYYGSVRDSLKLIEPKLTRDAIIVVDDYANEALPGAARAVDEWQKAHHYTLRVQFSLAVLR